MYIDRFILTQRHHIISIENKHMQNH